MKKRYRVVSAQKVLGHAPGQIFEADLPPSQAAPLLSSGAIVVVSHRDETKDKKEK